MILQIQLCPLNLIFFRHMLETKTQLADKLSEAAKGFLLKNRVFR